MASTRGTAQVEDPPRDPTSSAGSTGGPSRRSSRLLPGGVRSALLLLILAVLVPLVALQATIYYGSLEVRREQELRANLELARVVAAAFDLFVDDIHRHQLALGMALVPIEPAQIDRAERLLAASSHQYAAIQRFSLVDPGGRVIASSDPEAVGEEVGSQPYFQQILQRVDRVAGDLLADRSGSATGLVAARAIRDEAGTLQGVMVALIDPRRLGEELRLDRLGEGAICITDGRGRTVYRYSTGEGAGEQACWTEVPFDVARVLGGSEFAGVGVPTADGTKRMVAAVPIRSVGWIASASRPEAEAVTPVLVGLRRESGLLLLVVATAVLAALAIGRTLTAPMGRLREHALAIGRGELDRRVRAGGPRALEQLADAFNRMAADVIYRYRVAPPSGFDYVSPSVTRVTGYTPEELYANPDLGLSLVYPEPSSGLGIASPTPRDSAPLVLQWVRKDGERIWIEQRNAPVHDDAGNLVAIEGIVRDITERKLAEEERERLLGEIDAQRLLLQAVIDHAPAGIAVLDGEELRVKWANEAYARSLEGEHRHGELTGLRLQDYMPRAEENGLVDIFRRVASTRKIHVDSEYEYVGFARGVTYWRWSVLPLVEGRGSPDLMVLSMDITEQVQARKRMEELAAQAESSLAQLKAVVSSMAEGVIITDPQGNISSVNPAALHIHRFRNVEEPRRNVGELARLFEFRALDGRSIPRRDWPTNRLLRGESFANLDVRVRRVDTGETWIGNYSGTPVRNSAGEPILSVLTVRDVTAQKEAERLREEYIALISHDLRNPLTALTGQAQLLRRSLARSGDERGVTGVDSILKSARRMNSMIQDLVETARLESGQLDTRKDPTDLFQLISDVVERMGTTEERARIRLEYPEPIPPVMADPDRIERVVVNLVSNALKYSTPDSPVSVAVRRHDGEAMVSVSDQGIGIHPDEVHHLFQRFYRAKAGERSEGLGLGLYITRLIVEAHGGRIWVESKLGEGSKFTFSLPIGQPET